MTESEAELLASIASQEIIVDGRNLGEILIYISKLPIEHIQLAGCTYRDAVILKLKIYSMMKAIGLYAKRQQR